MVWSVDMHFLTYSLIERQGTGWRSSFLVESDFSAPAFLSFPCSYSGILCYVGYLGISLVLTSHLPLPRISREPCLQFQPIS